MRERDIQEAILRAVGALPYARVWRVNVGLAVPLRSKHPIRFGLPGMADLSGILACGRRLEIEVKSARGRLSEPQRRWRDMILAMRGEWLLGRSEAQVIEALEAHRLGCIFCQEGSPFFSGKG